MVDIERIYEDYKQAMKETNDQLDVVYARFANLLAVESDCSDDWDKIEYYRERVEMVKGIIVSKFMEEHGWFIEEQDDWRRWRKEL